MNRSDVSENEFPNADDDELNSKYQAPKPVPICEILAKDSNDPSLNKYKQHLIGDAINVIIEPSDPNKLILKKLVLMPNDHEDITFNMGGNSETFKDHVIKLKEGCTYRIKLEFYVQRDIISGLKFVQAAYKGPLRTDKSSYMLGSRPPKAEIQEYISEKEVAPSGMIARGKYHMKSHITDDDKNTYYKWEWILEIVKEWETK